MITPTHPVAGVQHFNEGVRVRHPIYGEGTVVHADRYTRGDMVKVRFDNCGEVRVLAQAVWAV